MKIQQTHIEDLMLLEPEVFGDSRGYFFESYNNNTFKELGLKFNFIQDNEAKSSKGVLRGLHFQKPPFAQTKLIRVIQGEILDVVVDLRENSKTYGTVFSHVLNDSNKLQLLVPKGFAHGYVVLSEMSIVSYKVDEKYMPSEEDGIRWNDETLNIDWILGESALILSEKDEKLQTFTHFKTQFV